MKHHDDPQLRMHDDAVDPTLEPWLDEALAEPTAPAGLSERVFAATRHRLPRRRGALARIGLTPVWRVAAVVALAGLLGWALVTARTSNDSGEGPVAVEEGPSTPRQTQTVALSDAEQRELLAAFAAAEGLDFEAYWLERRQAQADAPARGHVEAEQTLWQSSDDPVDMLLDTYEVEWLGAEEGPGVYF